MITTQCLSFIMDLLFYMGYYLALFLIPFVIYFLVFKKNGSHSIYTHKDWFYFVKLHYAKNAVRKYQEKYRLQYSTLRETEINIPTGKHSDCRSFYGLDQKGNSLSLTFTVRHEKIAEVSLHLRLADGNVYAFPDGQSIRQVTLPKEQWKISGLSIEILEPLTRLRLIFNGLLQNVAVKEYEKVEHVQFSLIFNTAGSPTYIPHGMDTSLVAEALARENWRDGSWVDYFFSVDQSGYEQFGALQGFVKGDSYSSEYVLNLATCQSRIRGIDDRFLLNRALRLFLVDAYGNLINIVVKSFKDGCSQLNYGSVILSSNEILPVNGFDIFLENVWLHNVVPEMITLHIKVKGKLFKCVVHLNKSNIVKSMNNDENGYECYNIPAECDVNSSQGKAVVEFWYSIKGNSKFVPNDLLTPKYVQDLPSILTTSIGSEKAKIVELTGGKGCSLGLLSSLNSEDFTVPDGFILTFNAFRRQVETNAALIKAMLHLDDVCCGKREGKLETLCAEVVNLFKKERIAPEIVEAITNELYNIKIGGDGNDDFGWAVRSSALGEDSEELSSAGQNDTFLGCLTEKEVIRSVTACWASLFTYQSVQYRRQHGLPVITVMAVVVQKMVPADSAGVLFTCHPSTSNPSQMVITSNYGLGESVVSGKADPDTFILNRTWDDKVCLIDQNIGLKNKVMRMTARGVEEIEREGGFEYAERQNWSLSVTQAVFLGRVGVALEREFGGPRDIEWAFYKGRLYLLQSRPITTLSSWSDFELSHELDRPILSDQTVLTVANICEVMPHAVTVLSQTSSVQSVARGLQLRLNHRFDPYTLKVFVFSQHSGMIDVIGAIHKNVRKEVSVNSKILDLAIFGHVVFDEKIQDIAVKSRGVTPVSSIVGAILTFLNLARKNHENYTRIKEGVDNLRVNIDMKDPLQVNYKKIEGVIKKLIYFAELHSATSSISVFYQIVIMNVLLECSTELTADHCADFANILSSCEGVISAEIPTYLEKIASIIQDEGYAEEFCTIKPQFGITWLEMKCPEAYKLFEEFLKKHGHRNLGEFEVMEESWAENPSKVITMVQANAKHKRSKRKLLRSVDGIIRSLVSPKSAITRFIIKFLIKKVQSAVSLRELTKSELVRGVNVLRLAYRQLATQLVLQGVLHSPDLIYHLTQYEIGQLIQRRNPLLVAKAVRRQRLYPKWNKLRFPEIMFGVPVPEKVESAGPSGKVCVGTPVCTGTVKARACVINTLDDIVQLQIGDVLITYCTDIGWSPYFPMLAGIVTEMGGLISHGAVVAREYGLPCIVGVRNVTKVFKTGDFVVLSGDKGEVGLA